MRLSCHDWTEGGNTPDDAAIFAELFKAAGADLIDCSSGQVVEGGKAGLRPPVPDAVLRQASATRSASRPIAVGAISEADHANSIIAAGRADLCAIARPHLADPAWTLHEAAKIGMRSIAWPKQYLSAKVQYETNLARAAAAPSPA